MPARAWSRLRRRILDQRGWRCARCSLPGKLELHHVNGKRADNRDGNLEVLCVSCHRAHHEGERWTDDQRGWRRYLDSLLS